MPAPIAVHDCPQAAGTAGIAHPPSSRPHLVSDLQAQPAQAAARHQHARWLGAGRPAGKQAGQLAHDAPVRLLPLGSAFLRPVARRVLEHVPNEGGGGTCAVATAGCARCAALGACPARGCNRLEITRPHLHLMHLAACLPRALRSPALPVLRASAAHRTLSWSPGDTPSRPPTRASCSSAAALAGARWGGQYPLSSSNMSSSAEMKSWLRKMHCRASFICQAGGRRGRGPRDHGRTRQQARGAR